MSGPLELGSLLDTIFAVASGAGQAAITVMRLSGGRTETVLAAMVGGLPVPRRASLRDLRDGSGQLLDRALVLWMPGPRSYTGEDTAELHLHGGRAVCAAVSGALLAAGARPAEAGEFTRRAFLAGRMDLLEAEAIGDLVTSETESQRTLALSALLGGVGKLVSEWATRLTRCLAFAEAQIDFPDETDGEAAGGGSDIAELFGEIENYLGRAVAGERVRNGLVFAISGAPNVGKSSLFNALAGRDVAIVSAQPGTTRDALEVQLDLGGVAVTLVDTAGLRQADDPVEAEGVRRAIARAAAADLVLHVVQGGAALPVGLPESYFSVSNKVDLIPAAAGSLGVSAKTGAGLDVLLAMLSDRARALIWSSGPPLLSRPRQVSALKDTRDALGAAMREKLPELRAEALRLALRGLGRLAGRVDTEAVLDVVFGTFCIGK